MRRSRTQCRLLIAAIVLIFTSNPSMAESVMDRLLTDYMLLHELVDENAGVHVELGLNANFSSYDVQVAIYERPLSKRWTHFETGTTIFSASDVPEDVKFGFEDGCYTVNYNFNVQRIVEFVPIWRPPNNGKALCFVIKSMDGSRKFDSPVARY